MLYDCFSCTKWSWNSCSSERQKPWQAAAAVGWLLAVAPWVLRIGRQRRLWLILRWL